jgi:hypothetical protein
MINGEGLIASDRTRYSSSFAARLRGLVGRGGQRKVVLRAFRCARARAKSYITPFDARCLRNRTFAFDGKVYNYAIARYNCTWNNERAVEVAHMRDVIRAVPDLEILEVGIVLKINTFGNWTVCEKHEEHADVLPLDVIEFSLRKRFKRIIAIATLEHVGFDEPELNPDALPQAVTHLVRHLDEGGKLFCTLPLGYNPSVDMHLRNGSSGFDSIQYLARTGLMRWKECLPGDAFKKRYGTPYECANALAICSVEVGGSSSPTGSRISK